MKIDLHLHTKTFNIGEPKERNIPSIDFFVKSMINNNIGVGAICNHDQFDIEQFHQLDREFRQNNYDFLLLPGAEIRINFEFSDCYKHLNIIVSNEAKNLYVFETNLNLFNQSSKRIKDLEIFKSNKYVLFYIDAKRNETSWTDEEIKNLNNELKKMSNYFVLICDVNNKFSLLRYRARGFNTLIGSDLRDWIRYDEISKQLIDINIKFESFDMFIKCFAYNDDQTYLNLFKKIIPSIQKQLRIGIDNKRELNIGDLKIYEGVNIIFGPKATGKTKILESINDTNKNKSIIYKPDIRDEIIKNYWAKNEENINANEEIQKNKNNLINIFDQILEYKEISFNEWERLFNSFDKKQRKILEYFTFTKVSKPELKPLKESLKLSTKLFESIKNIYEIEENDKKNIEKLIDNLEKIIITKSKNYWKMNLYSKIHSKLNELSILNNGTNLTITNIKLFERWSNRKNLKKRIDELKNNNWKKEIIINKGISISDRGNIKLKIINNSIDFNNLDTFEFSNPDSKFLKGNKTKLKSLKKMLEFNEFKNNNFIETNEDIRNMLNILKNDPLENQIIYEDDQKNIITLSNGERALLALTIIFDENKEYYLLDEPDTFLNVKNIFNYLINKIWEKTKLNKKIVITTHNPILAINSIPFNLIYREKDDHNIEYSTYEGNPWTKKFIDIKNEKNEKEFIEILLSQFEFEMKHFEFRKDVYNEK